MYFKISMPNLSCFSSLYNQGSQTSDLSNSSLQRHTFSNPHFNTVQHRHRRLRFNQIQTSNHHCPDKVQVQQPSIKR
ncbi:hypothetical protein FF38_12701 [Lucilia cuprina]|uniref:Uncharacterized protein n=1 Tax=Lucilia cuprina TaxID=7375 RepID=A0A0L0BS90_LUCCU|nr:hypothetical protein FF38_12701 [Lucilia cuprina]